MYAYTAGSLLHLDIGTSQKGKCLFHLKPVEIIYKGVAGNLLKQNTELALSSTWSSRYWRNLVISGFAFLLAIR